MSDKSTPSGPADPHAPPDTETDPAGGRTGSAPGRSRSTLRRALATAAAVGAVAVGLSWYFSRQPAEVTVVLEFERSRKSVRRVRVELEQGGKIEARMDLKFIDSAPKKHTQKLEVRKGKYTLRLAIEYLDGTRRRTRRKVKVEGRSKWVLTIR